MKNTAVNTARLLIIDDDRELGEMLKEYLQPEQFVVDACLSGEDGIDTLRGGNHDIVILDIMLPGMNGLEVLKQIRDMSDIPTIMLTAKGDDVDRILGLELGADDYLAKPFNPRELLARLKATLRRAPTSTTIASRLAVGDIELDIKALKVIAGGGSIRLTGTEFELLRCLAEAPGDIISKDDLSNRALGRRHMPYDRSIDTHMSNGRRNLGDAGVSNPSIQNRRGVGYCLLVEE